MSKTDYYFPNKEALLVDLSMQLSLTKNVVRNAEDKMWTMWQPENLLVGPRCTMCHMPPFREGQLVELHSQPPV